jgi:hypothetical protein
MLLGEPPRDSSLAKPEPEYITSSGQYWKEPNSLEAKYSSKLTHTFKNDDVLHEGLIASF